MSNKRHLVYTLTRTYNNTPLAVVESGLGGDGLEIEPAGLRALAQALLALADEAERQDTTAEHFRPTKGEKLLDWPRTA